jgi:hypothetical protein
MNNGEKIYVLLVFVMASLIAGLVVGILILIIVFILDQLTKISNKTNEKAIHGKVFIKSMKATNIDNSCMSRFDPPSGYTIYECEKMFPLEMRAEKQEEANLIIYMLWWAQHVGSYSSGNTACQVVCQIAIYSMELGKNIEVFNFSGGFPPDKIYKYGSYNRHDYSNVYGSHPTEEIKKHFLEIKELIKKNSLEQNVDLPT